MRGRQGLYLRTGAVLVLPALAVACFYIFETQFLAGFVLLHVLTLAGVLLFFRYRPCRVSVLPIAILLTLTGPYLYDTTHPGTIRYLGFAFMAVFYALPWASVALVAAVLMLVLDRNRNAKS